MDETYFYVPCWPVLHGDNHLLVLYKPAGLLAQGDRTGDISLLDLAKRWIRERYNKPGRVFLGLVHRLDRPVAGVMVFARTSKAAARLSEQFRTGRIRKGYLAVVEGVVSTTQDTLVHHLERKESGSAVVPEATPRSLEARLRYKVLETSGGRSLVRVDLETGRRHQIRVQMAHAGHPILGDLRYGASAALPGRQIALLARELGLEHPTLKTWLSFRSPLPQEWPWPGKCESGGRPPWHWSVLSRRMPFPTGA